MIWQKAFWEVIELEEQILAFLEKHVRENQGIKINEKAVKAIRENAKSFERLTSENHYRMKTEITGENTCVVRFTTETGEVISTYSFYNAVISINASKKR